MKWHRKKRKSGNLILWFNFKDFTVNTSTKRDFVTIEFLYNTEPGKFLCHYASRELSCGMLTKICRAIWNCRIFSHGVKPYFTGCREIGEVTFGNTLCTIKYSTLCNHDYHYLSVRHRTLSDSYILQGWKDTLTSCLKRSLCMHSWAAHFTLNWKKNMQSAWIFLACGNNWRLKTKTNQKHEI